MSERFVIERVTEPVASQYWPRLRDQLYQTQEHWPEFATIESIKEDIDRGLMQWWVLLREDRNIRFTALTRVITYDVGRAFQIAWVAGTDPRFTVGFIDAMEEIARKLGCFRLEYTGRRGWLKLLGPRGYKELFTVFGRDLGPAAKPN